MNIIAKRIQIYVIGIIYTCVVLGFFLVTGQKSEHHRGGEMHFPKRCHMHIINDNNDSLLQVSLLQNQKLLRDTVEDIHVSYTYYTHKIILETLYIDILEQKSYYITERLSHTFPPTIAETQRLLL